jgi:hypothetical protein
MQKYYFNIITKYSLIFGLVLIFNSCNAIFENDITEENMNLILPQNGQNFSTNQVVFKWEELDGATGYRIEIVSPSFSNLENFILDSLVSGDSYTYILNPGDYQFKIRGENSAYASIYTGPYSITIDSVYDLTNQYILLINPSKNLYTNSNDITCNWDSHYAAETYEFQLRSDTGFTSTSILDFVPDIVGSVYTITVSVLVEGMYSWGVKGHNQISSSDFSYRNIFIDLTNPNDVTLVTPLDDATTASSIVMFKWNSGVDTGIAQSPVSTTIEISTDSLFNTNYETYTNITADSLEIDFPTVSDEYWWRVLAIDEAGNQSQYYL